MARRYINTSKFNPYTFQEMYEPALMATQLHMQQAQNMAQLQAQAAGLGSFIDPLVDPEMYEAWNNYMNGTKQVSEELFNNGLSTKSFHDFIGLTQQYAKNIKPIEGAITNKQKYTTVFSETASKNPDMAFIKRPSDISLKEYAHGVPAVEGVSGNTIQKQVELLASHIYGNNDSAISREAYNKFYDIIITQAGLTPEQLNQELSDPQSGMNIIMKYVMQMNRVGELSPNDQTRMSQYAMMGAYSGAIGKQTKKMEDSNYYKQDAANRQWVALKHRIETDNKNYELKEKALTYKMGGGNGKSGSGSTSDQIANAMMGGVGVINNAMYAPHLATRDAEAYKVYDALTSFLDKRGIRTISKIDMSKDGSYKIGNKTNMKNGSSKTVDDNFVRSVDLILDPSFTKDGFVFKVGFGKENKYNSTGKEISKNYDYYLITPEMLDIGKSEFKELMGITDNYRKLGMVDQYKQMLDGIYATAMQNIQGNSNSFSKIFSGKNNEIDVMNDVDYSADDSFYDSYINN